MSKITALKASALLAALFGAPRGVGMYWPMPRGGSSKPVGKRVPDTQDEIDARAAVARSKDWNRGRRQHEKACVNVKKWRFVLRNHAKEEARMATVTGSPK